MQFIYPLDAFQNKYKQPDPTSKKKLVHEADCIHLKFKRKNSKKKKKHAQTSNPEAGLLKEQVAVVLLYVRKNRRLILQQSR